MNTTDQPKVHNVTIRPSSGMMRGHCTATCSICGVIASGTRFDCELRSSTHDLDQEESTDAAAP